MRMKLSLLKRVEAGERGLSVCPLPLYRNTDKPDASAVLLHDFQRFLIYQQKVKEATVND